MALDRGVQRQILERLEQVYPERLDSRAINDKFSVEVAAANIAYLQEHGLVDVVWPAKRASRDAPWQAKITARGLDFLADDGGLSAVLGVVVVQLHEDTLKRLLIEQVDASSEPEPIKSVLKKRIRELPAEAVKTVIMESLKAGMSRIPDLARFLQKILESA